jgi:hypothetical protein
MENGRPKLYPELTGGETSLAMFAPRQYSGHRRIASRIWTLPLAVAFCAMCGAMSGWSSPSKPNDPLERFARACGVPTAIQKSPRIFASPDERSWHEYQSVKEIPEWPSEWTETASVWNRTVHPPCYAWSVWDKTFRTTPTIASTAKESSLEWSGNSEPCGGGDLLKQFCSTTRGVRKNVRAATLTPGMNRRLSRRENPSW